MKRILVSILAVFVLLGSPVALFNKSYKELLSDAYKYLNFDITKMLWKYFQIECGEYKTWWSRHCTSMQSALDTEHNYTVGKPF